MKGLAAIHLLASLCSVALLLATGRLQRANLLSDAALEGYMAQAAGQCLMIFVMLLALLTTCVWERAARYPILLESFMILTTILSMSAHTFTGPRSFVKLQGHSLAEAFSDGYDSDSGILLILDVFVTGTHLGLPIRWFVMAPLELAAILLYVLVVFLIGSSEPTWYVLYNFLALFCLVICSALGKRAAEVEERRAYLAVINEKAMRFEVEFQLSQLSEKEAPEKLRSEGPSEAVTDRSGAIFDPLFEKGVDRRSQLELVAEKGDSEHWRIASEEVTPLNEEALGRGSFGSIQRAIFCGDLVAVKCPRLEVGAMKVADLCNELRILRHLRHPHIVTAHGAVVLPEEQVIYLVLELIEGPNLTTFLMPADPEKTPSDLQRYQVMLGVCRALLYMHTRVPHIIHGDIKGGNVMVELSSNGLVIPKVLDFGLSRVLNAHARALGGTLAWVAPEVVSKAPVRCSADVYSFGRLIAFTATGIPPMPKMSQSSLLRALQKKRPPQPFWPETCAFTSTCRPLVRACLAPVPEQRPATRQVYTVLLALASSLPPDTYLEQVKELAELMKASSMDLQALCVQKEPTRLASLPEDEEAVSPQEGSQSSTAPPSQGRSLPGRRHRRCRPFADMQETSRIAMQASLIACFRRWNSSELRCSCCERHAWARLGQGLCAEILSSNCVNGKLRPQKDRPVQCPNCGILDLNGDGCDLCGWEEDEDMEESCGPRRSISI